MSQRNLNVWGFASCVRRGRSSAANTLTLQTKKMQSKNDKHTHTN